MTVTTDEPATVAKFAQYAHPERLVSTGWLAEEIRGGQVGSPGGIVLLESDEDVLLYDTGHIPGAVKIDFQLDLNDPLTRDYVDGAGFAQVLGSRGIGLPTWLARVARPRSTRRRSAGHLTRPRTVMSHATNGSCP